MMGPGAPKSALQLTPQKLHLRLVIEGKSVEFLVDTGATSVLIFKHQKPILVVLAGKGFI